MKNSVLFSAAVLGTLVFCGCIIPDADVSPRVKPLPTPAVAPQPVSQVAVTSFTIENEVNTKLRAKINYSGLEADFSRRLAERLAATVILNKAEIVTGGPYDIAISVAPEFEIKDTDGEYTRAICREVVISVQINGSIYASKVIEPAPLPRRLGVANAKNQYLKQVASAAADFLSKNIDNISNSHIGVSELTFRLASTDGKLDSAKVAAQVEKLNIVLKSTNGIVNYTIVSQDNAKGLSSFRIVYMKNSFPQGLINVLNLKLSLI